MQGTIQGLVEQPAGGAVSDWKISCLFHLLRYRKLPSISLITLPGPLAPCQTTSTHEADYFFGILRRVFILPMPSRPLLLTSPNVSAWLKSNFGSFMSELEATPVPSVSQNSMALRTFSRHPTAWEEKPGGPRSGLLRTSVLLPQLPKKVPLTHEPCLRV